MRFQKGMPRPANSGRAPGTPNRATTNIKMLLDRILPEDVLEQLWRKYLFCKNQEIGFRAFEMAMHYRYGKPRSDDKTEDALPRSFDISAIPIRHEPIQ